jgi:ATP-dependent exoDNAse (exonuclease V) beta subunit
VTVRARAAADEQPVDDVEVVDLRGSGARPAGPRFGALVHATLALVPLDADRATVTGFVRQQSRLLAATDAEIAAAIAMIVRVLEHPLLVQLRADEARGALRREVPVALVDDDGTLVEGIVDLAFERDGVWTVVDFKTDVELGDARDTYLRQVRIYADAISRATGLPAKGILLRI